jgi:hypothetical protein
VSLSPVVRLQSVPALALLCAIVAHGRADAGSEAAALVVSLTGTLTVSQHGAEGRKAAALDWLPSDAVVESGEATTALVALANGRRYEIGPGCRARIKSEALEVLAGHVRELPRLSPLPRLSLLAADSGAGARAGALLMRSPSAAGARHALDLYPRADAVTLAANTTLSFSPRPGASEYHVEVEDEDGATIFQATTRGAAVAVSPGVLQPGRRYRWSVRGSSPEGMARGSAQFVTLAAEAVESRERLRSSLGDARDVASLTLLAEIDRSMGLTREARDRFALALEQAPDDATLRQAVAQLDARLKESASSE